MPARSAPADLDYVTLASYLDALAYPARLELLRLLRHPLFLSQIRLTPHKVRGGTPERAVARQTILGHLEKLIETDLVRWEQLSEDGRAVNRYFVNPQKLYALTEDLRKLGTIYAGQGLAGDATGTLQAPSPAEQASGPRLVLVHGVYEGKPFPLTPASARDGRWVIGRKAGLAVSLDYDPFVSTENAAVARTAQGFTLTDLSGSKNGTAVNWSRLPKGGTRALRSGDVVGVGRSLLVFVPE